VSDEAEMSARMLERQKQAEAATLERFTRELWAWDAVESLRCLLSNDTAVGAFHKFLETEYSENNLDFFTSVRDIKLAEAGDEASLNAFLAKEKDADVVYKSFVREGGEAQVNLPGRLAPKPRDWKKATADEKKDVLQKAEAEILKMMALDCFPRFVRSPFCSGLIEDMSAGAGAPPDAGDAAVDAALVELRHRLTKARDELPASSSAWLERLAMVADVLPVCVVVSDMVKEDQPLCYVNDYFCTMTGYAREEIIGINCRFLQRDNRDQDAVRELAAAIAERRPTKVMLDNFRKDGEPFRNLLSMKPIFDSDGGLVFFVGVQYPVTRRSMEAHRLVQHERLLNLLPSSIALSGGGPAGAPTLSSATWTSEASAAPDKTT